ncbi:MAG: RNA methyltransferase substrate-binding domain-containing protein, partial [Anaerolineae bacterium]
MAEARPPAITSTSNPRIVAARKLRLRKYRQEAGLFLVEGLQLLHMALDAGATAREVFYCEEQFAGSEAPVLLERFRRRGAALCRVAPRVMETLSEREEPQGIVATFPIPPSSLDSLKLTGRE